jgi:membrane protease YdiL (CAAX protease family)
VNPRPDWREPLALGAVLLAYSNGLAAYAMRRGEYPERLFVRLNPLFVAAMLAYASRRQGGLHSVGLSRKGVGRSLVGGVALGAALTGPPLLFFYKPILLDTPLEYGPISGLSKRELLRELFLRLPIGVAVLEELGFRGLLYAALRKQLPTGPAIALDAAAFAGWHFAVTATSAAQTNLNDSARLPPLLRPYVQPLAVAGGMLTTGLAGVGFALLRERSGNLSGPMLAHWLVDGAMVVALWVRRPTREAP